MELIPIVKQMIQFFITVDPYLIQTSAECRENLILFSNPRRKPVNIVVIVTTQGSTPAVSCYKYPRFLV